jgi:two-component system, OmpR family, sensor histidine kinase KdpD
MSRRLEARDFTVLAGSVVAIAALIALLREFPHISPTTVALTLLLVVLAAATLARLVIALMVSVLAMLALNFFFLPPLGTFTIADPQNWVGLFVFLVVAIIASNLSAAAQERTREAITRRNEVTRLFELTRDVLLTTDTADAIPALTRHVARRFELSRVAICLPAADDGWHMYQGGRDQIQIAENVMNTVLAQARQAQDLGFHAWTDRGNVCVGTGDDGVSIVPLRHGAKAIGLLAVGAPGLHAGTMDAIAGVVAIAIERAQFLVERDNAELVRQKADLAATLLATLSHDFRTPLTTIRVAVENVCGEIAETDRRAQAQLAIAELDRLTRLFQDILDMARIDAAAIPIERQWVTPADIVDAAMAHVRHALDGRTVNVEGDAEFEVAVDPRLASGALSHLLENAAQYSRRDDDIVVLARTDHDGLHVSVTDHGPGLDPRELDQLFDRFFRGRTARKLSPGTGMGLAITRGLLGAAGGRYGLRTFRAAAHASR